MRRLKRRHLKKLKGFFKKYFLENSPYFLKEIFEWRRQRYVWRIFERDWKNKATERLNFFQSRPIKLTTAVRYDVQTRSNQR
jgi:hypothetical protein